jgi:hypothetical protein
MNTMEFELHLVELESNSMYFNSMQFNLKKINSIWIKFKLHANVI